MRPNATALIIPVEPVATILQPFRERHIHTPAVTVPAHVTLYAPFKRPTEITDALLAELSLLFSRSVCFSFVLQNLHRFDEPGVLYLAPEPAESFLALSRQIQQHYPDVKPDFSDPVMHLTIAQGYPKQELAGVEQEFYRDYASYLPFEVTARQVCLYVKCAGVWSKHSTFAFAQAPESNRE